MKNISLSLKITVVFIAISVISVVFMYVTFSELFEHYMLKTETEKVTLIAETIEPMIAMNVYLGLTDESVSIAQQLVDRNYVLGGSVIVNDEIIWEKKYIEKLDHIHIEYPVKDPLSETQIGLIHISYSTEQFNKTINEMRQKVINYLALMSILFLSFALIIRYLLKPLSDIAERVKDYNLGDDLDFKDLRLEPETRAISNAFSLMMDNVREYTVLLEQYKLSVDESSIVSKMSPDGAISYVNDEFIRVCGYSRDQLIGSDFTLLNGPDMDKGQADLIASTMQDKKIWKGVLKNKTKSNDDYYVKSTIVPLLDENNEIKEFISIQHDITQVVQQHEQILRQTTDANTGLQNRIKLSEDVKLKNEIIFALLSLDNYEIIKNYYGYDVALSSTKQVAVMLKDLLEPKDVKIYKLAGGEFGLFPTKNIDIDWFKQICKYTIEKIEDFQVKVEEDSIDLHASVGLTQNKSKYLSYSGLALQQAQSTRKSVVFYEDQENLIAQYENNMSWTRKIKSALADNRITLFVQPLVDVNTMQITKYECLVRLIDEDGKYVSPFFFLDVAKKTKLYHLITHKVISLSFEVFSQIPDKEFAINLSAEDILHKETVDYLERKIIDYNIGNRVVLEIVESEGIDGFDEVIEFIARMKALGCKIAIDDFGTGYSNFSYLMQLKVDYIKVDGSLIKDIDHNVNSQIICSTILNFSSALEMSTVAEFVHSEEVLKYVKNMGFDYLQGYHLGEPMPIHNLLD